MSLASDKAKDELADIVQDVEARFVPIAGDDVGVAVFVWTSAGGYRWSGNGEPDEVADIIGRFLKQNSDDRKIQRVRRRTAQ